MSGWLEGDFRHFLPSLGSKQELPDLNVRNLQEQLGRSR